MEFKKFYYLDVVLTGGPKYSKFEIKVWWKSPENPPPGNVVEDLIKLPPNDTKGLENHERIFTHITLRPKI